MNNISFYIKWYIAVSLISMGVLFTACSDEAITPENEPENIPGQLSPGDNIFLTIDLSLPATRSETTDEGGSSGHEVNGEMDDQTEKGQPNENSIQSFVLDFYVDGEHICGPYNSSKEGMKLSVEVKMEDMEKLVGKEVSVRVAANIQSIESTETRSFSYSIEDFGTDGKSVPMANYNDYVVDMTALKPSDGKTLIQHLNDYIDSQRHINLTEGVNNGTVTWKGMENRKLQLERGVARVDYKPSQVKDAADATGRTYLPLNVYQVGEIPNLYVQMADMQVFNVSKQAFVFRHISAGTNTEGGSFVGTMFEIERPFDFDSDLDRNDGSGQQEPEDGGSTDNGSSEETPNNGTYNWVTDTDWEQKDTFAGNEGANANFGSYDKNWAGPFTSGTEPSNTTENHYFINQPVKDRNGIFRIIDKDSQGKPLGVLEVWKLDKSSFNPWCYITENTLPSTKAMINGLSTGIAFNLFLCNKQGEPILYEGDDFKNYFVTQQDYDKMEADYAAWVEGGKVGNAKEDPRIKRIVGNLKKKNNSSDQHIAGMYELTIGGQTVDVELRKVKVRKETTEEVDGENKTTVSYEEKDAFVLTYYYYFRHNMPEPHELGTVAPMQFAVVRNNIYKISVTSLNSLPDPYDPGKHDEPQENYISVETAILSWARIDKDVEL